MLEHQTSLGAPTNQMLNYSEIHPTSLLLDISTPYINEVCPTENSKPDIFANHLKTDSPLRDFKAFRLFFQC